MADTKFPTEVISLPSKGYFYPEDSPLSSGEIEIKYCGGIGIIKNCDGKIKNYTFNFK